MGNKTRQEIIEVIRRNLDAAIEESDKEVPREKEEETRREAEEREAK